METFNYIAIAISIAGSAIIIWGVLRTFLRFIVSEIKTLSGKTSEATEPSKNYPPGKYVLLGLDFMLSVDIIHTIHRPVLDDLYILGMIVGIRTIISYFLIMEMKQTIKHNIDTY